jgi:hypothetical protein
VLTDGTLAMLFRRDIAELGGPSGTSLTATT